MAFSHLPKNIKNDSLQVCKELDLFNICFYETIFKINDGFVSGLEHLVNAYFNVGKPLKGPVILKLSGSLTDLRLLLLVINERLSHLGLHCMVSDGSATPFSILQTARLKNKDGKIPLIFLINSNSIKFPVALLDGLQTEKVPAVVAMFCNESRSLYLPPILEASVPFEYSSFLTPRLSLNRVLEELVYRLPCVLGISLSGRLLHFIRHRFLESRQSFSDMNNVVCASISEHLMHNLHHLPVLKKRTSQSISNLSRYFPMLEVLTLYLRFWYESQEKRVSKLDLHIDIQNESKFLDNILKQARAMWHGFSKSFWLQFLNNAVERLSKLEDYTLFEMYDKSDVKDVVTTLKGFIKTVQGVEEKSQQEQMKKNLLSSPSRRKPLAKNNKQFNEVVHQLEEMFTSSLQSFRGSSCVDLAGVYKDANVLSETRPKFPILDQLVEQGYL